MEEKKTDGRDTPPAEETERMLPSEDNALAVETEQSPPPETNAGGEISVARPKRKYGWVGTVLLVAVIALGVYLMFKVVADMGEEVKSFGEVIAASDWRFAVISLSAVLITFACIWLEYAIVMKTTTGKFRLAASLKTGFIGKFYDNITPLATGGQPMQIYYLNKKGLHGGESGAVVLIRYFAWMFCWIAMSTVFMAAFTGVLAGQEQSTRLLLTIGGWIGLVVNMFIPVFLILFVIFPRFSHALTTSLIKAGCKIKLVKDRERAMARVQKIVDDFRNSFKIMSRSPLKFIILILLCLTEIFLTYAFPYFIMKMFSGLDGGAGASVMFSVIALNFYATMSASIVPTPGNSGAIEGLVTAAFSSIAGSVLLWTVFGWRFGVYYIFIIIGLIITIVDFIRNLINKKRKKG